MEPTASTAQLAPKVRPVSVMEHVMAITFLLLEAQRTHICVAKSALLVANPQASIRCVCKDTTGPDAPHFLVEHMLILELCAGDQGTTGATGYSMCLCFTLSQSSLPLFKPLYTIIVTHMIAELTRG